MPRRGGSRSSSPRRSAASSSGGSTRKTESKPEPTRQPAPAAQPAHPAPHTPSPAAPAPSGPGFFARAAELGAGIAIGHVAGRALENVFFGGREASPEQLEKAEQAAKKGPCSVQYTGFMKCLEKNDDDAEKCDWAFDMFKECQSSNRSSANQWGDELNQKEMSM